MPLGNESLVLADRAVFAQMAKFTEMHPGVKFRTVRVLDAICVRCKKRYRFLKADRIFVEVSVADGELKIVSNSWNEFDKAV